MKTLNVHQLTDSTPKSIDEISVYMDKHLKYEYIEMLNWPVNFPYKPACSFKIACTDTKLYIRYYIAEKNIKALYTADMDSVWEDSCVEFFCKIPGQDFYYNFEFNCIGTCLATKRKGREENVMPFNTEQLKQIERFSSLGTQSFEEKSGYFEWSLTVAIPFELIGFKPDKNHILEANFYKCGDKTSIPHYLSWSLIQSIKPDFHLPEFFGLINFCS